MYSKEDLLTRVEETLEKALVEKTGIFYKEDFLDYKGKTKTGETYSEILSDLLLQNHSKLENSIPLVEREKSYKVETHKGESTTGRTKENSNRKEEHIALNMFDKTFNFIGKVLDYQIPLKNKQSDNAGKIDLLSFNNGSLNILELKKPDSNETLLRCVLEVYTYWRTINREKLSRDFEHPKTPVRKGILVCENSQAHKDYLTLPKTKELTLQLDVEVYIYTLGNEGSLQIKSKL